MPRDISGAFSGRFSPDVREFDPRKCCRVFLDAYDGSSFTATAVGTVRHCNYARQTSGTISHTMQYDDRVGNFFSFTSASSTAGSRCWITDRVGVVQNALMAGIAEMDVQAMVRIPVASVSTGANVGFVAAHGAPGDLMPNGLHFEAYNASGKGTTWFACTNAANALGNPVSTRIDTGISVLDWHALRVWINKDATRAVWTIDDVVVREERNPKLFPTWENQVARGDLNPNIVAAQNGLQACCRVRADDSATNDAGSLDVNWFLYRYFREYS